MTFIPTTSELEEMGFETKYPNKYFFNIDGYEKYIYVDISTPEVGIAMNDDDDEFEELFSIAYPQSKQDIETLVRLFTKP